MLDVTVIPPANSPLVVQTVTPTLPINFQLLVDRYVLTPTATATLTLTV